MIGKLNDENIWIIFKDKSYTHSHTKQQMHITKQQNILDLWER